MEGSALRSLEEKYFTALDGWFARGAPTSELEMVAQTCGKLAMVGLGFREAILLSTVDGDEYRFRVDVCVKMTANRVYPQPEFRDAKMGLTHLRWKTDGPFPKLCVRSGPTGLKRPARPPTDRQQQTARRCRPFAPALIRPSLPMKTKNPPANHRPRATGTRSPRLTTPEHGSSTVSG